MVVLSHMSVVLGRPIRATDLMSEMTLTDKFLLCGIALGIIFIGCFFNFLFRDVLKMEYDFWRSDKRKRKEEEKEREEDRERRELANTMYS